MMKTTISIPIPPGAKILVEAGKSVENGTLLAQKRQGRRQTISLSKAFKVTPENIKKFLQKKEGDTVLPGDVLVRKPSFLTEVTVTSPLGGRIEKIDIYQGIVTIISEEEEIKVTSPVSGKVKKVNQEEVEVEFSGRLFEAKDGRGNTQGSMVNFLGFSHLDIYALPSDIFGKIILGESINKSGVAKAEALEVGGLILAEAPPIFSLPFLIFAKEILPGLAEFTGNMVILDGERKRLIIPFK